MSTKAPNESSLRYLQMLDELKHEFESDHGGKTHGWAAWASRTLGFNPKSGYIHQVVRGEKMPALDAIERAIKRGVRPRTYFFPDPTTSSADQPTSEGVPAEMDESDLTALGQFLALCAEEAYPTVAERAALVSWSKRHFKKGGLNHADFAQRLSDMRHDTRVERGQPSASGEAASKSAEAAGLMSISKRK